MLFFSLSLLIRFEVFFLTLEHTHSWLRSWASSIYIYWAARQLYKNISMLFLFPVKDGKLSTGVNATFNASCYG